jgi:hypothetical protein
LCGSLWGDPVRPGAALSAGSACRVFLCRGFEGPKVKGHTIELGTPANRLSGWARAENFVGSFSVSVLDSAWTDNLPGRARAQNIVSSLRYQGLAVAWTDDLPGGDGGAIPPPLLTASSFHREIRRQTGVFGQMQT